MLYGAILGDIIGSQFEFDCETKSKEFELFGPKCEYTDDTIMTLAVAKALRLLDGRDNPASFKLLVVYTMQQYGRYYPFAGYGGRFGDWLCAKDPHPYNSYGNGSAMRVSAVGWAFDTLEKTREYARFSAEVTHNHPEGIKGAEATAAAMFLARTGHTKAEIRKYIVDEFRYDLDRTIDGLRPGFQMYEDCQRTVPESIIGFLEADSYEETLRNVISLGGDTDTTGAIAGAIAEAYYGIPQDLIDRGRTYLDRRLRNELDSFLAEFEKK